MKTIMVPAFAFWKKPWPKSGQKCLSRPSWRISTNSKTPALLREETITNDLYCLLYKIYFYFEWWLKRVVLTFQLKVKVSYLCYNIYVPHKFSCTHDFGKTSLIFRIINLRSKRLIPLPMRGYTFFIFTLNHKI